MRGRAGKGSRRGRIRGCAWPRVRPSRGIYTHRRTDGHAEIPPRSAGVLPSSSRDGLPAIPAPHSPSGRRRDCDTAGQGVIMSHAPAVCPPGAARFSTGRRVRDRRPPPPSHRSWGMRIGVQQNYRERPPPAHSRHCSGRGGRSRPQQDAPAGSPPGISTGSQLMGGVTRGLIHATRLFRPAPPPGKRGRGHPPRGRRPAQPPRSDSLYQAGSPTPLTC
jgi:hypothetical protein